MSRKTLYAKEDSERNPRPRRWLTFQVYISEKYIERLQKAAPLFQGKPSLSALATRVLLDYAEELSDGE